MVELPVYDHELKSWSVPKGYAHPKCRGCGHNYFGVKPTPKNADGSYPDIGLCHWCLQEQDEDIWN